MNKRWLLQRMWKLEKAKFCSRSRSLRSRSSGSRNWNTCTERLGCRWGFSFGFGSYVFYRNFNKIYSSSSDFCFGLVFKLWPCLRRLNLLLLFCWRCLVLPMPMPMQLVAVMRIYRLRICLCICIWVSVSRHSYLRLGIVSWRLIDLYAVESALAHTLFYYDYVFWFLPRFLIVVSRLRLAFSNSLLRLLWFLLLNFWACSELCFMGFFTFGSLVFSFLTLVSLAG